MLMLRALAGTQAGVPLAHRDVLVQLGSLDRHRKLDGDMFRGAEAARRIVSEFSQFPV
jgi:hypothetical protein